MIFAIDFDNTVVEQAGDYADLETPLRLKPGAMAGLTALKAAGHILLLYSARANRALVTPLPAMDPLHIAGVVNRAQNMDSLCLNVARYDQMVAFVEEKLPGIFDAIDDGMQGKPNADLFIDDKAITFGPLGMNWQQIAGRYGETG